jgi:S-adenosylmethionine-diacylglycerol 3-amino-3-carboxypropyl transferase
MPPLPPPDAWALLAARLPLAFAQVREDPRLDLELASVLPYDGTVVMVASGGDTAVCLSWVPLKRLLLVDMNSAQLELSRLKWHLAQTLKSREVMRLLGHLPMPGEKRREVLELCFEKLRVPQDVFGPLEVVATLGPDHAGRYEITFAELRQALGGSGEYVMQALQSGDSSQAAALLALGTQSGEVLDEALASVMSLANLVCLFGAEATQNPRLPFHRHFAGRIRDAVARPEANANPFLWQMLAGRFPDEVSYDWIQHCHGHTTARTEPEYKHGRMKEVLESLEAESVDLVHLSNILDWLSEEDATATLEAARRVLKPGGKVILRQLNSTLDVPYLDCGLVWDTYLGRELQARDRSFFYPHIHVGTRL